MITMYLNSSLRICYTVALIFLLFSTCSYAQGPGLPGGPDYDPDKEVPIDGGLGFILAVGLAYGVKKIRASKDKGCAGN